MTGKSKGPGKTASQRNYCLKALQPMPLDRGRKRGRKQERKWRAGNISSAYWEVGTPLLVARLTVWVTFSARGIHPATAGAVS